jgi:hypothetical protein
MFSSSEEESDEEDFRPVFVPKSERITIQYDEAKKVVEEEKHLKQKQLEDVKQEKTRAQLADALRKLEEKQHEEVLIDSDVGNPDNDETFDDELEASKLTLISVFPFHKPIDF